MKTVIISLLCVCLISEIFKIAHNLSKIKAERIRKEYFSKINLIDSDVSYDEYKKIANRASVRNTTVRKSGDFWDFILPFAKKHNQNHIESKLSKANCGGNNE